MRNKFKAGDIVISTQNAFINRFENLSGSMPLGRILSPMRYDGTYSVQYNYFKPYEYKNGHCCDSTDVTVSGWYEHPNDLKKAIFKKEIIRRKKK